MIRLTLALLAVIFLTFAIAGTDRGQQRYGLMSTGAAPVAAQIGLGAQMAEVAAQAPQSPAAIETQGVQTAAAPQTADPEPAVVAAVYVPVETLIAPLEPQTPDLQAAAAESPAPLAEPQKLVMFVAVSSANVREGPSKDFSVVDKLVRGEAVTVVALSEAPDGWTLIRLEGDGTQGYVSSSLLSDQP